MSSTFGTVSVVLCLLLPCASCFALMAALPLGVVAIQMARGVLAAGPDEVAEVQARHGMTTGTIAVVYSSILIALILGYLLVYFAMIAAVVAAGI